MKLNKYFMLGLAGLTAMQDWLSQHVATKMKVMIS